MLRTIFGSVVPGWASGWPCERSSIATTRSAQILLPIYDALVAHRGHSAFVRRRRLPPCDYFVPGNPGFLVEYDEVQHFTTPRAITLSSIPGIPTVAFDQEKWLRLAREIDARDNDPPYRDEQRAWYDVLRDVLPAEHQLGPTARLLDREIAYCTLDHRRASDISSFRDLLGRPEPG